MKIRTLFPALAILLFLGVACEKETVDVSNKELDTDVLALVEEEILADINFAELLDEGDDGIFWDDAAFSMLKSAEGTNECRTKTVKEVENKRIVTLDFTNGNCGKDGVIVIVYHKNGNRLSNGEKTVTFKNFVNRDGTKFNGIKYIKRGDANYNIKAEMKIARENRNGDSVFIARNYNRQVHWICGLLTGKLEDNIKKITGQSKVTKTIVSGDEKVVKEYSRKITKPLLIVKSCDVRIQAGAVKIKKANGTEVEIDYGKMPKNVDCDFTSTHNCNNTFKVTKDGVVYNITVTVDSDGVRNRVKVVQTED